MAAAVNRWPCPVAGSSLELPFLGSVLRVRLPMDGEGKGFHYSQSFQSRFFSAYILDSPAF